jgi:hypothetical protein
MSRVSSKLRRWAGGGKAGYTYWCQGCEMMHGVITEGPGAWGFNGNVDAPTFTPSVLTTWNEGEQRVEERCHTFVTDGRVQFLSDCTHALAGQTLPLPDLPEHLQ